MKSELFEDLCWISPRGEVVDSALKFIESIPDDLPLPKLVELTPKRRDILALLERASDLGASPTIPGVRVFEKLKLKR